MNKNYTEQERDRLSTWVILGGIVLLAVSAVLSAWLYTVVAASTAGVLG